MNVSQISVCDMVAQSGLELGELYEFLREGHLAHPFLPADFHNELLRRWQFQEVRYRDRTALDQLEFTAIRSDENSRLIIEADGVVSYSLRVSDRADGDAFWSLVKDAEDFLHDEVVPVMGRFLNYDLSAHEKAGRRSDMIVLAFADSPDDHDVSRFFERAGERDYARLGDVWLADGFALIAADPSDDVISFISYAMAVRRFCVRHLRLIRRYWELNTEIVADFSDRRRLRHALERVSEIHEAVEHSSSAVERIRLSCERRHLLLQRAEVRDVDLLKVIRDKLTDAELEVRYILQKLKLLTGTTETTRQRLDNHFKQASVLQMDWLQTIFLTSTIAALLALGAMPGSRLLTLDAEGNVVSEMVQRSFDFRSLLIFVPVAILVTVVVRLVTAQLYNRTVAQRVARERRRFPGGKLPRGRK